MNLPLYIPVLKDSIGKYFFEFPKDQKIIVLDIDDTIYKSKKEITERISLKIRETLEKIGVNVENDYKEDVEYLHSIYKSKLKEGCLEKLDLVENFMVDLSDLLDIDIKLRETLENLNHKIFGFTNSSFRQAKHILSVLNVEDLFEAVFVASYDKLDYLCKPMPDAFEIVENILNVPVSNIIFFDDNKKNCDVSSERGWNSIHIESNEHLIKKLIEYDKE